MDLWQSEMVSVVGCDGIFPVEEERIHMGCSEIVPHRVNAICPTVRLHAPVIDHAFPRSCRTRDECVEERKDVAKFAPRHRGPEYVLRRVTLIRWDRCCWQWQGVGTHREENERILTHGRYAKGEIDGVYRSSAAAKYGALAVLFDRSPVRGICKGVPSWQSVLGCRCRHRVRHAWWCGGDRRGVAYAPRHPDSHAVTAPVFWISAADQQSQDRDRCPENPQEYLRVACLPRRR